MSDVLAMSTGGETVDVAVNIFAKPFQTALSLLSLLEHSGRHVDVIWLQFEPFGSRHDSISPYHIAHYLQEERGGRCRVFQPEYWLDLNAAEPERFSDAAYRLSVRYQFALENSQSRRLFLMHNDVLVMRDILGQMLLAQGTAFAVGKLGQCWNCPARDADLTRTVMGRAACTPGRYEDFQPDYAQLCRLYALAHERNVFARPYDQAFEGIFDAQPWPLPECRINEWACLLDLEACRLHCAPQGTVLPPGAFRQCGPICLDTGVEFFRGMHARGLRARHFDIDPYLKHWVGTGKMTPRRYALAEENAFNYLRRHYPRYLDWLSSQCGKDFRQQG